MNFLLNYYEHMPTIYSMSIFLRIKDEPMKLVKAVPHGHGEKSCP